MRNIDVLFYDYMSPRWLKNMIRDNEDNWQNYSDEELIRWLYIELGKRFSFSRKYRYAVTDEEKAEVETAALYGDNASRIFNADSVTCIDIEKTLHMLVTDLYGIDSRILTDGSGPHVYLEITTSERKRLRLDLQQDLYNIKSRRRTEYFAAQDSYDGRNFDTIDPKHLEEIDSKLGYINGKYMNEEVEEYSDSIKNSKTEKEKAEKLFILLAAKFSNNTKTMKYCERAELYKKIINEQIPDNHFAHRTFRSKGELFSCFIVPDENGEKEYYYLYNKSKRSYEEVEKERFLELDKDNNKEIDRLTEAYRPKKQGQEPNDDDDAR